jgi:hypothetical protein
MYGFCGRAKLRKSSVASRLEVTDRTDSRFLAGAHLRADGLQGTPERLNERAKNPSATRRRTALFAKFRRERIGLGAGEIIEKLAAQQRAVGDQIARHHL